VPLNIVLLFAAGRWRTRFGVARTTGSPAKPERAAQGIANLAIQPASAASRWLRVIVTTSPVRTAKPPALMGLRSRRQIAE
jgi:hypothetical protein